MNCGHKRRTWSHFDLVEFSGCRMNMSMNKIIIKSITDIIFKFLLDFHHRTNVMVLIISGRGWCGTNRLNGCTLGTWKRTDTKNKLHNAKSQSIQVTKHWINVRVNSFQIVRWWHTHNIIGKVHLDYVHVQRSKVKLKSLY